MAQVNCQPYPIALRLKLAQMDSKLTSQEHQILSLMAEGLAHKETAGKLFISPDTVRKHIDNIYAKLNSSNKIKAISKLK